jgi:hypothetical protein
MKRLAALLLLACASAAPAFDANGVKLGGGEAEIRKAFPSARCKALEWKSDAAERRCDDGKISFGGAEARITFFLKANAIQAFDVRFDARDLERVRAHLKSSWGPPLAEATEVIARKGREGRQVHKMRWERGADRAVLTSQERGKRASLEVWRGSFETEIYRVK